MEIIVTVPKIIPLTRGEELMVSKDAKDKVDHKDVGDQDGKGESGDDGHDLGRRESEDDRIG